MRAVVLIVFCTLLLALQYRFWAGENSFSEVQRLREQIQRQQAGNAELELRNQLLRQEIDDLRNGYDAVEERARHELGMIRQDEEFFRVIHRTKS